MAQNWKGVSIGTNRKPVLAAGHPLDVSLISEWKLSFQIKMKSIVDGECGQSNALVGLAQSYGRSNQRIAPSTTRGTSSLMPSSSMGENFANEFLMQKGQHAQAPRSFDMSKLSQQLPSQQQQSSSSSSLVNQWTNEFAQRPNMSMGAQWANQYQSARPSMENAWASATGQSLPYQTPHSSSSVDSAMWSAEFLDNVDTSLTHSQSDIYSDAWADAEVAQAARFKDMDEIWDDVYQNGLANFKQTAVSEQENVYVHEMENPFINDADCIANGDQFVQNGDLGNAILAYEAATQRNPQDAGAWCKLGLSLAENEQDAKAISAYRKCLEIAPRNTEAILALSVSLANESLENDALEFLEKWIVAHKGGDPTTVTRATPTYSSFLDHNMFSKVEQMYLDSARQQAGTADAELQNALGILYNLNRNFDRAVDCLRLAIASKPDDPRLWNRLGATLANGDRTPEAIASYREALDRYPAYVRARYNLGISCMHLNSYREAIEHFTNALDLQKGEKQQSTIWTTMRSAVLRLPLGPSDNLLRSLDTRNVETFKNALNQVPR